jgi:hypothetical protein
LLLANTASLAARAVSPAFVFPRVFARDGLEWPPLSREEHRRPGSNVVVAVSPLRAVAARASPSFLVLVGERNGADIGRRATVLIG